ncbi:MAG: SH3 domain-containing protein [Anaerolineae bacterium]|nr:SH3 domain-containing protein [Anaerolineae bacterium]
MVKRVALVVIILALFTFTVPAGAQSDNFVVVNTSVAHIRSGPSFYTTSLGTVVGGTELPVTGRTEHSTWWRVDSSFGEGWISGEIAVMRGNIDAVPIVSEPTGTPEDPTIIVEGNAITVYRNPNPDSFVVGIAPTGAVMVVTGLTTDGEWYQIHTVMGPGFVRVGEVAFRGNPDAVASVSDPGPSFDGPTIRVNMDTPVTTEPGGGDIIGTIPAGTALPAGGRTADNAWWQVRPDFGIGWIPVNHVSLAGAATNIAVTSPLAGRGPAYTGATFATILIESPRKIAYAEDSFSSDPMWDARLGEQCSVVARTYDGLWLKVTKDGYVGWMHFSGITLQGDMSAIPAIDTTPPPIVNVAIVNTTYLNVRSGPDVKYERLYTTAGGDRLTVTGRHADLPWLRVEDKDTYGIGWVPTEFIIFRGNWAAVPAVTEPIGDLELPTAVIDFPHNVYGHPDKNSFVGAIPGGIYTITGWNADYSWAMIETEEFGEVWIHTDEFALRGTAENAPIVG